MPNFLPRAEYSEALPGWRLVKRCVAGAREVRKHDIYLPMPDPENKSPENQARYKPVSYTHLTLPTIYSV